MMFCEVSILVNEIDREILEEMLKDIGIKRNNITIRGSLPDSSYTKDEYVFKPSLDYRERCVNCGDPKKSHEKDKCLKLHNNKRCGCIKFIPS